MGSFSIVSTSFVTIQFLIKSESHQNENCRRLVVLSVPIFVGVREEYFAMPSKKKQFKKIDISDFENVLEKERQEEGINGSLKFKKDTELFVIDKKKQAALPGIYTNINTIGRNTNHFRR